MFENVLLYPNVGILAGSLIIGIAILSAGRSMRESLESLLSDMSVDMRKLAEESERANDAVQASSQSSQEDATAKVETFING